MVIPACIPPHKEQPQNTPEDSARLRMTRLAFADEDRAEVSDIELSRKGISYTVDTLCQLKSENPNDELVLLMGTDMLLYFEQWRDYARIAKMARLAVFPRSDSDADAIERQSVHLSKTLGADISLIKLEATEISSSQLRELLPQRRGCEYFADGVYEEIIKHRYYDAQPDLDWLRGKAYTFLDDKRKPHVAGCQQEAIRLAERWDGNTQMAAEAAILHDITKKLKAPEQLAMCREYGILSAGDELSNYKLLHAKTGAAFSKDKFGISQQVYNAILWHTTAKENMSLLEKIIYMADYIEPTRNFQGVEKLRRLAYENLDRALILGLKMSMNELMIRGIRPHINSIKALSYLERHVQQG